MIELTDQELQALVNLTGLMPCDRLPKKDPNQELKKFLIRVAVNINGAVKSGAEFVRFSDIDGVAPVSKDLMAKAEEPLELLGYHVVIFKGDYMGGDALVTATYLTISGWGD